MNRARLGELWPPMLGGLVAISAALLLRSLIDTRLLAEVSLDAMVDILPGSDFSTLLGVFGPYGKALFFLSVLVGQLSLYVGLWQALPAVRSDLRRSNAQLAVASALASFTILLIATEVLIVATDANLGQASWLEYGFVTAMTSGLYASIAALQAASMQARIAGLSVDAPPANSARRQALAVVPGLALGGLAMLVIGRVIRDAASGGNQTSRSGPSPPVTSNENFYVISKNLLDPQVQQSGWTLHVGGLVGTQLDLAYDDLLAFPAQEQYTTLQCVSNEVGGDLISNALWRGVSLRTVLERAGVQNGASHILMRCSDGYTDSIPLDFATRDSVVLAYQMNGETLPEKHGFPVRLLTPGKYGMKHPKWITDIMLMDEEVLGYWQQQGWSQEARMKTSVRIDVPSGGTRLDYGMHLIEGIAFSGDRGISRVEVSVDNQQTWQDARLKPPLGPYTWVLWDFEWELSSTDVAVGDLISIWARATDGDGELQTAVEDPPFPDGATGYHYVGVRPRQADS